MLIQCRECRARVSDDAKKCPRCGCRAPVDGQYFYREGGCDVFVNEGYMQHCPRCSRETQHRYTNSTKADERGTINNTKIVCKICGKCDFTQAGESYMPTGAVGKSLSGAGDIIGLLIILVPLGLIVGSIGLGLVAFSFRMLVETHGSPLALGPALVGVGLLWWVSTFRRAFK